jgi:hypothetical protein
MGCCKILPAGAETLERTIAGSHGTIALSYSYLLEVACQAKQHTSFTKPRTWANSLCYGMIVVFLKCFSGFGVD